MFNYEWAGARARVWRGGVPAFEYEQDLLLQCRMAAQSVQDSPRREAAVELSVHLGGRIVYGLLGAEFQPGEGSELCVGVKTCVDDLPNYDPRTPYTSLPIRPGLNPQFGFAVLRACASALRPQAIELGSGVLRFHIAAHHDVNSCDMAYICLTRTLLALLRPETDTMTEADVRDLVLSAWKERELLLEGLGSWRVPGVA